MSWVQIIARTPPAICLALGGVGWLSHVDGSGWLLLLGTGLQALYLLV